MQLQLDELIRATKETRNTRSVIEGLSEEELDRFKVRFERLARKARAGRCPDRIYSPGWFLARAWLGNAFSLYP